MSMDHKLQLKSKVTKTSQKGKRSRETMRKITIPFMSLDSKGN